MLSSVHTGLDATPEGGATEGVTTENRSRSAMSPLRPGAAQEVTRGPHGVA